MKKKYLVQVFLFCLAGLVLGQESITVNLSINIEHRQNVSVGYIKFQNNNTTNSDTGFTPNGIQVIKTKMTDNQFELKFISRTTKPYVKPQTHIIKLDSSFTVNVQSKWKSSTIQLPYIVNYQHLKVKDGYSDIFYWIPHYRAEGLLRLDTCEVLVAVLDYNGNGIFGRDDFHFGTTIKLDINNDGELNGKEETFFGNQIIEYCGKRLEIEELAIDGSMIQFKETETLVLKVGDNVPFFEQKTISGETISSKSLFGFNYILDFWASTCAPCIKKLPQLKKLESQFNGKLKIIGVNVDDKTKVEKAKLIIDKYNLGWPHIINGKGQEDQFWKMFGSHRYNAFGLPLYILVNARGKIVYADYGGNELDELVSAIKTLFSN